MLDQSHSRALLIYSSILEYEVQWSPRYIVHVIIFSNLLIVLHNQMNIDLYFLNLLDFIKHIEIT